MQSHPIPSHGTFPMGIPLPWTSLGLGVSKLQSVESILRLLNKAFARSETPQDLENFGIMIIVYRMSLSEKYLLIAGPLG